MEQEKTKIGLYKKLDKEVGFVLSNNTSVGFEMAYSVSSGISKLKTLLTTEYMKPIMELQGTRLGFKTDKKYPEDTVRNCLIEAVLMGVQPFGNQFNIIAGNTYITKEGFGYLLLNIPELKYSITPGIPRTNSTQTESIIDVTIKWKYKSDEDEKVIQFPIKTNKFMGSDGVIGKSVRKSRAWLHNYITGTEFSDGDAENNDAIVIQVKPNEEQEDEERLRILGFIRKGISEKSVKYLETLENNLIENKKDTTEYLELIGEAKLLIIDQQTKD